MRRGQKPLCSDRRRSAPHRRLRGGDRARPREQCPNGRYVHLEPGLYLWQRRFGGVLLQDGHCRQQFRHGDRPRGVGTGCLRAQLHGRGTQRPLPRTVGDHPGRIRPARGQGDRPPHGRQIPHARSRYDGFRRADLRTALRAALPAGRCRRGRRRRAGLGTFESPWP